MARIAYRLSAALFVALFSTSFAPEAFAAPATRWGFSGLRGVHSHGRATAWPAYRGHRPHALHHPRFGHFRGSRLRHVFPVFGDAGWPGVYSLEFDRELVVSSPISPGLPAAIGIRSAPTAAPAIYVIEPAGPSRVTRQKTRSDRHPGPRTLAGTGQPSPGHADEASASADTVGGVRIVHVRVPRGL